MKKRILTLALALLMCLSLAAPTLAAELPAHILQMTYGGGNQWDFMSLSNFVSEDTFQDNDYYGALVHIYYATAPATLTALSDISSVMGVSEPGFSVYRVNKTGERRFEYPDEWTPIPLATGEIGKGELHGTEADILPAGSTYVLEEGAYSLPYASEDELFFIVVSSEGTAPNAPAAPAPAQPATARPTSSSVLVNGKNTAFDAYNIANNNYFKLRDLAFVLSGTEKQFEVTWVSELNTILLTPGEEYTAVGGEMASKGAGSKTATPTTSKVAIDGTGDLGYYQREISLTAYNIGGNNYFKLRDIGQAFNFGVDWDGARNTIVIDTSKGYTPEGASAGGNNFDEIAAQKPQTFVYDRPAYGIKFEAPDFYGDVVCGESFYFDTEPVIDFDGEPAAFKRDSEEYTFSVFVTDAPSLTLNTYFYKSGEMHIQTAKGTAAGNTVKLELTRLPDGRHSAGASASYQIPRGLSGIFAKFDADDEGWGGLYGGCIIMSKSEAAAFIESGAFPAYLNGLTITGLDAILSGK
jgi:hypothetical protein